MAVQQLRIDRLRRAGGRIVCEYSHATAVSGPAHGTGCAWESLADVREQLQALREWLRQPEQLVLLALLAQVENDPSLTTLGAATGRILTLDTMNPTTLLTVS